MPKYTMGGDEWIGDIVKMHKHFYWTQQEKQSFSVWKHDFECVTSLLNQDCLFISFWKGAKM